MGPRCPECGAQHPPEQKFCAECGAALGSTGSSGGSTGKSGSGGSGTLAAKAKKKHKRKLTVAHKAPHFTG